MHWGLQLLILMLIGLPLVWTGPSETLSTTPNKPWISVLNRVYACRKAYHAILVSVVSNPLLFVGIR